MKRFTLILLSLFAVIYVSAQPKLIGHRGSWWGVENTAEAFINGAKKGYHCLETDVKVTKDGVHVCCHNDDLKSWGGTLTIADNTLEALKAETLSQTHSNVTYTGNICTLAEYLDICKEYNVIPIIELKWATGINSNDTSGIPNLIKVIEEKGFRNSCYIFTSMKPCLQYIHDKYPDIQLMLLVYSSGFESSLLWCSERGIHMGVGVGAEVTKEGVERYHKAGLKVNAWSCNTSNAYKTYGNYGCDFITTDYLDPTELPELDPDVLFPPNTVDYPEKAGAVRGKYNPTLVSSASLPDFLKGKTVRRALMHNDKWYVLALNADNTPILTVLNSETGEEIKRMDLTGVENLNDIAFSADGVLLGCNATQINPDATDASAWKVYKWADDNATPQLFVSQAKSGLPFELSSAVTLGSSFAVSGTMNDLYLYSMVTVDGVEKYMFLGTKVANGAITSTTYAADNSNYTTTKWGNDVSIMVTPFSRNNLLIDGKSITPVQYSFDWEKSGQPMVLHSQWKEGELSNESIGHSFLRLANKIYAYPANLDGGISVKMFNVAEGIGAPKAVSPAMPNETTEGTRSYVFTGIEHNASEDISLYIFSDIDGLMKYVVKGEKLEPSQSADFALETIWENSRNRGNAPEHIDGTNAQQGAAYKGVFYVNDCVDSTLYLFNSTGCIGGIPGGAGWGTACDDAGNIIIRDDKDIDGKHKLIIYPSGVTVDNPGEPIKLDITIPLTGQTNFISASGDVLGSGGYIYMYPNKQSQINIIYLENGKVVEIEPSDYITLTGSTAGYVIPINNNSEDWIYNVRASGIYRYQGGENIPLLTGRGSTTPPTRNTSGGGDYFTLSGHEILIHPSGANYRGGFTIRDWSTDSVLTTVEPIGDLGYSTGGNYSTFNWLFAEKIDESSYYIYSYCPANGMAIYRFYDKSAGVESVIADKETMLRLYPNPVVDEFTIESSEDINAIMIYNLSGAMIQPDGCVIDGSKAVVNVGSLPTGIYFVKMYGSNNVGKFIKK